MPFGFSPSSILLPRPERESLQLRVLHPLLNFQSVDLPESLPEIVVTPIKIGVTCNLCSRMWPIMGRIHQSCPYGILYDVEKQGFECAPALLLPSEHMVKPLAL